MRATGMPSWIVVMTVVDRTFERLERADSRRDRFGQPVQAKRDLA